MNFLQVLKQFVVYMEDKNGSEADFYNLKHALKITGKCDMTNEEIHSVIEFIDHVKRYWEQKAVFMKVSK